MTRFELHLTGSTDRFDLVRATLSALLASRDRRRQLALEAAVNTLLDAAVELGCQLGVVRPVLVVEVPRLELVRVVDRPLSGADACHAWRSLTDGLRDDDQLAVLEQLQRRLPSFPWAGLAGRAP